MSWIVRFNSSIYFFNSSLMDYSFSIVYFPVSISFRIYVLSVSNYLICNYKFSVRSRASSYLLLRSSNSASRSWLPFIKASNLLRASSSYERNDKIVLSFSEICCFNSISVLSASAINSNLVVSSSISICFWPLSALSLATSCFSLLIYSWNPDYYPKLTIKTLKNTIIDWTY